MAIPDVCISRSGGGGGGRGKESVGWRKMERMIETRAASSARVDARARLRGDEIRAKNAGESLPSG